MNNGVSKKVCVLTGCCSGVAGLATGAEDTLPFAFILGGMFIAYLIERIIEKRIDHGKKEIKTENSE